MARTGMDRASLLGPLLIGARLPRDGPLIHELKVRGLFAVALTLAGRIVAANASWEAREPGNRLRCLKRSRVQSWCAALWDVDVSALRDAMILRGFHRNDELERTARRAYAYVRFCPKMLATPLAWEGR